jgi:hypothetical protein
VVLVPGRPFARRGGPLAREVRAAAGVDVRVIA